MTKKYYAVKKGRKTGIFSSWDECKKSVIGYAGAIYKGFDEMSGAQSFLRTESKDEIQSDDDLSLPDVYAFVDGSYNIKTRVYGYGGFLVYPEGRVIIQGNGNDADMADMRNVAGEISGCMAALKKGIELGVDKMTIFYDYSGIELWATGAWKTNKTGTKAYKAFYDSIRDMIKVDFVKVKGHSGIDGNEEADRLAKEAAGIKI